MQSTGSRRCYHPLKKIRQDAAVKRTEARSRLTTKQQIENLDKILGEGKGAMKERSRLTNMINGLLIKTIEPVLSSALAQAAEKVAQKFEDPSEAKPEKKKKNGTKHTGKRK